MKRIILIIFVFVSSCAKSAKRGDPMMNPGMFQGDMLGIVRDEDRNAIPLDSQRWPNGEIPYIINSGLNSKTEAALKDGMTHIASNTCIRFVERTTEKDYVKVFSGDGCYSHWGRIGGEQHLSLGFGCSDLGTVVHELLHAVGFEHEHNRSDRDDYLIINWQNVDPMFKDAFETLMPHEERLLTDFDFDSVMLYGSEAFTKEPGLKTMEAIDGRVLPEVYHKKGLSANDIERVKILYDC